MPKEENDLDHLRVCTDGETHRWVGGQACVAWRVPQVKGRLDSDRLGHLATGQTATPAAQPMTISKKRAGPTSEKNSDSCQGFMISWERKPLIFLRRFLIMEVWTSSSFQWCPWVGQRSHLLP